MKKADFQLKNIQHVEAMSEETNCFTAHLYLSGKRIAEVSNHGTGGSDYVYVLDQVLFDKAVEWCKAQPAVKFDGGEYPFDIEVLVGELLQQWLIAKDEKRIQATYKRWCKNKTVFRLPDDKEGSWRTVSAPYSPRVQEFLNKKFPDVELEVLNLRFMKAGVQ